MRVGEGCAVAGLGVGKAETAARFLAIEFDEAVRRILEIICTQLGWDWGALWQPVISEAGSTTLRCTQTWRRQRENRDEFERISRCTGLPPGVEVSTSVSSREKERIGDSVKAKR